MAVSCSLLHQNSQWDPLCSGLSPQRVGMMEACRHTGGLAGVCLVWLSDFGAILDVGVICALSGALPAVLCSFLGFPEWRCAVGVGREACGLLRGLSPASWERASGRYRSRLHVPRGGAYLPPASETQT